MTDGIVDIHGKQYKTVAYRINEFRQDHPNWNIETEILSSADLIHVKATIYDEGGRQKATGHSEESRGDQNALRMGVLEVAETSAVGRALAFLGYGGTEIASADEMQAKDIQLKQDKTVAWIKSHSECVRDNWDIISEIKDYLAESEGQDIMAAKELYDGLPEETRKRLWVAPTKGGIFTTRERSLLKELTEEELAQAQEAAKNMSWNKGE